MKEDLSTGPKPLYLEIKMKKKTHSVIILDRSGSMNSCKKSAVDCYNEHAQMFLQEGTNEDLETDVSLITFNNEVYEHLWCEPSDKIEMATVESYQPMGGTSVKDAIGYVIDKFQSMPDANDPNTAYLVIVVTDGETNSDKHYGGTQEKDSLFKELVQGCQLPRP